MQIALVIGYTFLFLFIIRRMKFFAVEGISPNLVSLVFILKVMAGCSLGLLYTFYYKDRTTADTFKFFDDSKIIFDQLTQHPKDFLKMLTGINGGDPELDKYYTVMNAWNNKDVLFNDNKTIIRLNLIFHLFSVGYYYVHVVLINFISFSGLMALFRLFQTYQKDKSRELFAAVMFLPSMLFWGSGLLKDGLLLFALGMLLYSLDKLIRSKHSTTNVLAVMLSVVLLIFTKLYVIITIFPGIIAWYWARKDGWKNVLLKFSLLYICYFAIAFNLGSFFPKYDIMDIIYWKQKNFLVQAELTQAKSVIEIPLLKHNLWSIIQNSPKAILNVLVRPTVWESSSPLILMSALENVLILLVIAFCIIFRGRMNRVPAVLFVFSIFFVVLMFDLIGLITPILGAIVRYKVPALPFFMFILICIYDKARFKEGFSKGKEVSNENT